jgi:plastocyanin
VQTRRRTSIVALILGAAAAAACGGSSAAAPGPPPVTFGGSPTALSVDVTMPNNLYLPSHIDIQQGGTVHFIFPAFPHNVIWDRQTGMPADIDVTTDSTISRTFTTAGTFTYFCTLHVNMLGVVVVH